jgi:hypothetical protein
MELSILFIILVAHLENTDDDLSLLKTNKISQREYHFASLFNKGSILCIKLCVFDGKKSGASTSLSHRLRSFFILFHAFQAFNVTE